MAGSTADAMEDRALRLRDENADLKRTCNEQRDAIKRLTTKIAIYEENMRKAGLDDASAKYIEAQVIIAKQQDEIATLRKQLRKLQEAKRAADEVARGKRPHAVAVSAGRPVTASGSLPKKAWEQEKGWKPKASAPPPRPASPPHGPGATSDADATSERAAATQALINQLRQRLAALEERLRDAAHDNDRLQRRISELESAAASGPEDLAGFTRVTIAADPAPLSAAATPSATMTVAPRGLSAGLSAAAERALRDKEAQLILLKSRHEQLEAQTQARSHLYERAMEALEAQTRELRDTRAALQRSEAEADSLRTQAERALQAEADARDARDEARRIEDRLHEALTSPFFQEGDDRIQRDRRLRELEAEDQKTRTALAHLQGTVRAQHAELQSARKERDRAQSQLDEAREQLAELRVRAEASARGSELLRRHLSLFTGGEGSDAAEGVAVRELEEALLYIRRRHGGEIVPMSTEDSTSDIQTLRRHLHEARSALLDSQAQAERAERMLRTQSEYTKDLETELADLARRRTVAADRDTQRLAQYEAACRRKEATIRSLRAQLAGLLERIRDGTLAIADAGAAETAIRSARAAVSARDPTADADVDADVDADRHSVVSALTDEAPPAPRRTLPGTTTALNEDEEDDARSVVSAASMVGSLRPGETMLEVYTGSATLVPDWFQVVGIGGPGADATRVAEGWAAFAVIDVWDFESQASPPASASAHPRFHFAARYRCDIGDDLLTYLARESAQIDLFLARDADARLVARATVPLHVLLLAATGSPRAAAVPLVALGGVTIGTLAVRVRTAVPLGPALADMERRRGDIVSGWKSAWATRPRMQELGSTSSAKPSSGSAAAPMSAPTLPSSLLVESERRSAAELIVRVVEARDLLTSRPPSAYAELRMPRRLRLPSRFTAVARASTSPVWEETTSWLVPIASESLREGSSSGERLVDLGEGDTLQLTLFDDSAGDAAEASVIGSAALALGPLSEGPTIKLRRWLTLARGPGDGSLLAGGPAVVTGRVLVEVAWAPGALQSCGVMPDGSLPARHVASLLAAFGVPAGPGSSVAGAVGWHVLGALLTGSMSAESRAALGAVRALLARCQAVGVDWRSRLQATAEEIGRPGGRLSPSEVATFVNTVVAAIRDASTSAAAAATRRRDDLGVVSLATADDMAMMAGESSGAAEADDMSMELLTRAEAREHATRAVSALADACARVSTGVGLSGEPELALVRVADLLAALTPRSFRAQAAELRVLDACRAVGSDVAASELRGVVADEARRLREAVADGSAAAGAGTDEAELHVEAEIRDAMESSVGGSPAAITTRRAVRRWLERVGIAVEGDPSSLARAAQASQAAEAARQARSYGRSSGDAVGSSAGEDEVLRPTRSAVSSVDESAVRAFTERVTLAAFASPAAQSASVEPASTLSGVTDFGHGPTTRVISSDPSASDTRVETHAVGPASSSSTQPASSTMATAAPESATDIAVRETSESELARERAIGLLRRVSAAHMAATDRRTARVCGIGSSVPSGWAAPPSLTADLDREVRDLASSDAGGATSDLRCALEALARDGRGALTAGAVAAAIRRAIGDDSVPLSDVISACYLVGASEKATGDADVLVQWVRLLVVLAWVSSSTRSWTTETADAGRAWISSAASVGARRAELLRVALRRASEPIASLWSRASDGAAVSVARLTGLWSWARPGGDSSDDDPDAVVGRLPEPDAEAVLAAVVSAAGLPVGARISAASWTAWVHAADGWRTIAAVLGRSLAALAAPSDSSPSEIASTGSARKYSIQRLDRMLDKLASPAPTVSASEGGSVASAGPWVLRRRMDRALVQAGVPLTSADRAALASWCMVNAAPGWDLSWAAPAESGGAVRSRDIDPAIPCGPLLRLLAASIVSECVEGSAGYRSVVALVSAARTARAATSGLSVVERASSRAVPSGAGGGRDDDDDDDDDAGATWLRFIVSSPSGECTLSASDAAAAWRLMRRVAGVVTGAPGAASPDHAAWITRELLLGVSMEAAIAAEAAAEREARGARSAPGGRARPSSASTPRSDEDVAAAPAAMPVLAPTSVSVDAGAGAPEVPWYGGPPRGEDAGANGVSITLTAVRGVRAALLGGHGARVLVGFAWPPVPPSTSPSSSSASDEVPRWAVRWHEKEAIVSADSDELDDVSSRVTVPVRRERGSPSLGAWIALCDAARVDAQDSSGAVLVRVRDASSGRDLCSGVFPLSRVLESGQDAHQGPPVQLLDSEQRRVASAYLNVQAIAALEAASDHLLAAPALGVGSRAARASMASGGDTTPSGADDGRVI